MPWLTTALGVFFLEYYLNRPFNFFLLNTCLFEHHLNILNCSILHILGTSQILTFCQGCAGEVFLVVKIGNVIVLFKPALTKNLGYYTDRMREKVFCM